MTTDDMVRSLYICARQCNDECAISRGDRSYEFCANSLRIDAAQRLRVQDRMIKTQAAEIALLKDALEREIKWPEVNND